MTQARLQSPSLCIQYGVGTVPAVLLWNNLINTAANIHSHTPLTVQLYLTKHEGRWCSLIRTLRRVASFQLGVNGDCV